MNFSFAAVSTTYHPPPCPKVKPSPNLSSGSSFVLVQPCPSMKSVDTLISAIRRSEISLLISRKQETSISQSTNDQLFIYHFKMRISRYYLLYIKLLSYTYLCYEAYFQDP